MSWGEASLLDDSWNSIDPAAPRIHGDFTHLFTSFLGEDIYIETYLPIYLST